DLRGLESVPPHTYALGDPVPSGTSCVILPCAIARGSRPRRFSTRIRHVMSVGSAALMLPEYLSFVTLLLGLALRESLHILFDAAPQGGRGRLRAENAIPEHDVCAHVPFVVDDQLP